MRELTGKEVAESVYTDIRTTLSDMIDRGGRMPSLAVILVGDDPRQPGVCGQQTKDV